MMRIRLLRKVRDEAGAILLIVAAGMAAFIFIAALVVDTANWFEHKRHLQLQVDAAALAGADSLALAGTCDTNPATNTADGSAHKYGGSDATHPAPNYNDQVGSTPAANMHILVNSTDYWVPSDPAATDFSGGAPCSTNSFCPGGAGIDVKGTERDLPWMLGYGFSSKTNINAHARVCLMQQTSAGNTLPIAVPNPKPRSAAAIFFNEQTGSVIKITTSPDTYAVPLAECINPAPPAPPTCPALDTWTSNAATVNIKPDTGVYIALSGLTNFDYTQSTLTGLCDQPLTTCFDDTNDPPTAQVNFIRGWSNSPNGTQPNPPNMTDARLFSNGSCTGPGDQYFEVITGNCSLTFEAKIDIGALSKSTVSFIVSGAGCPNKGCAMTKDISLPASPECAALSSGANGECWRASIPINAFSGTNQLTVGWNETTGTVGGKDCTKGQGCSGTITNTDGSTVAQQTYAGDHNPADARVDSGPLQQVEILGCSGSPPSCASPDANSLIVGNNTIALTIQIAGALKDAQSPSDNPPDATCTFTNGTTYDFACLKVAIATGSSGNSQSLDCDPYSSTNNTLLLQLANGCAPEYKVNTQTAPWTPCPAKNQLYDPGPPVKGSITYAQPWQCIATFSGNKISMVGDGINRRIYGAGVPTCNAYGTNGHNNWQMFDLTKPNDGFPEGDKRIVGVYLTAYGAFLHTSGTSVTIPVTDFANFYITGYYGSPCPTNLALDPHPDDPVPDKGTIVGHFIKYVNVLNNGGGNQPCDPTSFGACVPVMTK